MKNPWLVKAPDYYPKDIKTVGPMSIEDRIDVLGSFSDIKLQAVITYPHTQKTVRIKAEKLLKRRKKNVNKSGG